MSRPTTSAITRRASVLLLGIVVVALPAAVAAAAPTPDPWRALGERRVSGAPTATWRSAREPAVAAHPTLPGTLAVAYVQGTGVGGAAVLRISHDGGRSWTLAAGHPAGGGNHPAIAWGPGPRGGARLYAVTMFGADGIYHPAISASDDEGASWRLLHIATSTRGWFGGYPAITVDTDPASAGYGRVWVAYNWLRDPVTGMGMRVLCSRDLGASWSEVEVPPATPPAGYPASWRIGYSIAAGPDGSAYVSGSQLDLRTWDVHDPFADGGSANVGRLAFTVAHVRWDPNAGRLRQDGARVALTLPETAWNLGKVVAGINQVLTDPSWMHGLVVARGSRVVLAVNVDGRIRIARSADAARTWRVTILPPAPLVAGHAQLLSAPDLVRGTGFIALLARSIDATGARRTTGVVAAVSRDGGRTWDGPRPYSAVRWPVAAIATSYLGTGLRQRAAVTAGGRTIVSAWGDARDGLSAVWSARIRVPAPAPAPTPSPAPTVTPAPPSTPIPSPAGSPIAP